MARVSDSIIQRVVETRRPIVVADALHDAEWSGSSSVVNLKLCSVMCAPLDAEGRGLRGHLPRQRQRGVAVRRPRPRAAHRLHRAGLAPRPERDAARLPPARERRPEGGGPVEAVRRPHRRRRVDARGLPAHREGGRHGHLRPGLGRDRHRQGGGGAGDPPPLAARAGPVRGGELRGDPRVAPRVGALRAREGRVHRRDRHADRPVPGGPRRARSSSTRSARCRPRCR